MPEDALFGALTLTAALLSSFAGLAWLALALEPHWQQVTHKPAPSRRTVLALWLLGVAALAVSLLLRLRADHGSMAALVWVMALAAAALGVAFVLAWRPRWLAPLAAWSRVGSA